MNVLKKLMKEAKAHEMVLGVLFVVYIVSGVKMPEMIASLVDSMMGQIVIMLLGLSLFLNLHPIAGVLAIVVCYEIIRRSADAKKPVIGYMPPVDKVERKDVRGREFPRTLEEEMVHKMAPLVKHAPGKGSDYKPVMNGAHGASDL